VVPAGDRNEVELSSNLLHLVGFYIIVSMMHGHTNICKQLEKIAYKILGHFVGKVRYLKQEHRQKVFQ